MTRLTAISILLLTCAAIMASLPVYGEEAAPAPTPPEPTLPEVVVRPNTQPYTGPTGGTISWSSDAITSFDTPVGPYQQPDWTTQRPFPTTRVYVLPPGEAQVEQWFRPTFHRDGSREFLFLEELSVGLPGRFQIDVYERWNVEPNAAGNDVANHEGVQMELRYALADWGVLPLNPTLYLEWVERGGRQEKPNKYEIKLLLGDEIMPGVFFGSNVAVEEEVSGDRQCEVSWSNAIGVPIIEHKLMAGIEMQLSGISVSGARNDPEVEFLIGPSLHWRPCNRAFVDVVGLFGATPESPKAQMYVVFGYQFGSRAGPSAMNPASAAVGR